MDNTPEREQSGEQRRGIASFAAGIEGPEPFALYERIRSKQFKLGDLGEANLLLLRPLPLEGLEVKDLFSSPDDEAFTIDLSGKIIRGNIRDFYKQGHYTVSIYIYPTPNNSPIDANIGQLQAQIWINNTEPIVNARLRTTDSNNLAIFDDKNTHFVLPNNPEVLETVRISVTNEQNR